MNIEVLSTTISSVDSIIVSYDGNGFGKGEEGSIQNVPPADYSSWNACSGPGEVWPQTMSLRILTMRLRTIRDQLSVLS